MENKKLQKQYQKQNFDLETFCKKTEEFFTIEDKKVVPHKVAYYAYTFTNKKFNQHIIKTIFKENKDSNKISIRKNTLIDVISTIGRIARANLIRDPFFVVSQEWINKFISYHNTKLVKKIIRPFEMTRGNTITNKASTYDFLGLYKGQKLAGRGVLINPIKFRKLLEEKFNDLNEDNFSSTMQSIVDKSKIKLTKNTLVINDTKKAEQVKNSFDKISKTANKVMDKVMDKNDIISFKDAFYNEENLEEIQKVAELLKEEKELDNLFEIPRENYIPLENVKEFYDKYYNYLNKLVYMEEKNGFTKNLENIVRKFKITINHFDLSNYQKNIVKLNINGEIKSFVKYYVFDNISKRTGRNYNVVASTPKITREILFKNYISIDVSNMAGKSIYELVKATNKEDFKLFSLYANNRKKYFEMFKIRNNDRFKKVEKEELPKELKETILKKVHLSILFSRDIKKILEVGRNKYSIKIPFIKDFYDDLVSITEDFNRSQSEDINFQNVYIFLQNNYDLLVKFQNEVKKVSSILDNHFGEQSNSIRKQLKGQAKIFMLVESDLISKIENEVNKNSTIKAERIHDEILIYNPSHKDIKFIYNLFKKPTISIKNKIKELNSFSASLQIVGRKEYLKTQLNVIEKNIFEIFKINNKFLNNLFQNELGRDYSIQSDFMEYLVEKKLPKYFYKSFNKLTKGELEGLVNRLKKEITIFNDNKKENSLKLIFKIIKGFKGDKNKIETRIETKILKEDFKEIKIFLKENKSKNKFKNKIVLCKSPP